MSDTLDDLRADFERACKTGRVQLLDPLPRKVRLRLWLTGRIDAIGIWLADHEHCTAAERWWRLCGKWWR